MDLRIEKTQNPKAIPAKVDSFGQIFTDHMFVMNYTEGTGWHDARIMPYDAFALDPGACVLHYGQGIFEGLKAYRNGAGEVRLFRPEANFARLNKSASRLCMPEVDVDFMIEALKKLVQLEEKWIPQEPGTSLYIRPYMFADEPMLGIYAATSYMLAIILSPSGPYYKNGLAPIDIVVEEEYVRAVRGGLGEAKTLANYAASLLAGEEAMRKGYSQVLWLDGVERKYIEEVGSMNIMFKIAGKVITPPLNGSILPGITRDSVLHMLRDWGTPVEEYHITIDEVVAAAKAGELEEIFGTGTAAVISPVGKLIYRGEEIKAQPYTADSIALRLYEALTSIQTGQAPDPFGWVQVVE